VNLGIFCFIPFISFSSIFGLLSLSTLLLSSYLLIQFLAIFILRGFSRILLRFLMMVAAVGAVVVAMITDRKDSLLSEQDFFTYFNSGSVGIRAEINSLSVIDQHVA